MGKSRAWSSAPSSTSRSKTSLTTSSMRESGRSHLFDDDDGLEAELDGLGENEAGLRHGALGGVHQQQASVGHAKDALDRRRRNRRGPGVSMMLTKNCSGLPSPPSAPGRT